MPLGGDPPEAHLILAEVKADTPDDVWLYNNAGLEYGAAGDHERAIAWLTEGLELAIATGDPELLVAQMSDLRRESLVALGRELEARVDEFLPDMLAALDAAKGPALAPTAAVPPAWECRAGDVLRYRRDGPGDAGGRRPCDVP